MKIFNSYLISQFQLDILLNSMNCNSIYGIERKYDKDNVDRAMVYVEINKMISAGLISVNNGQFNISGNIRSCLQHMAESDNVVHIYVGPDGTEDYLCYMNKAVVDIVSYSNVRDKISVTEMSRDEFKSIFLPDILPDVLNRKMKNRDEHIDLNRENELIELCKAGVPDYRIKIICELISVKNGEKRYLYGFNCNDMSDCTDSYIVKFNGDVREDVEHDYDREELIMYISDYKR